jgi:hypothetical protein
MPYVIFGLPGYVLSYKRQEFRKKKLNLKYAMIFPTTFSEIFLNLRRTEQDTKSYIGLHITTSYSRQILIRLEPSRQIFEKY